MDFDSYDSPAAQRLLEFARRRRSDRSPARRTIVVESLSAIVVLAVAVALAASAHWGRPLSAASVAIVAVCYIGALQIRFPVGSVWSFPTQIVFVPMLFVLPTPIVPLVVIALTELSMAIDRFNGGDATVARTISRVGDCAYTLGPALVLVLTHAQSFSWHRWPVLVLALVAQIVLDLASGLARNWLIERTAPSEQLQLVWIYLTDGCLSCAGLVMAAVSAVRPGLLLLTLPTLGLLYLFARERQERLDGSLELSTAYRGTALLLGSVVESDHEYTGVHSREVVDLSLAVADELGLDPARRRDVEFGALLHDVGKINVPNEIINRPGKLDAAEWEIMKRHTIDGEAMLKQVGGLLAGVGAIVRASHEDWDGTGYPDGLKGEAIPIESRIVTACDAFNAIITDRSYRQGRPPPEALVEMRRCSGTQFDPTVVLALDAVISRQIDADHRHSEVRSERGARLGG